MTHILWNAKVRRLVGILQCNRVLVEVNVWVLTKHHTRPTDCPRLDHRSFRARKTRMWLKVPGRVVKSHSAEMQSAIHRSRLPREQMVVRWQRLWPKEADERLARTRRLEDAFTNTRPKSQRIVCTSLGYVRKLSFGFADSIIKSSWVKLRGSRQLGCRWTQPSQGVAWVPARAVAGGDDLEQALALLEHPVRLAGASLLGNSFHVGERRNSFGVHDE